MGKNISVDVELDPAFTEPHVVIKTDSRSDLIDKIERAIERCADEDSRQVAVEDDGAIILLERGDIFRVYTENRRLAVCTSRGVYASRLSLREFEALLDSEHFVRISRFEIINLKKIRNFDLSTVGTIRVVFEDGSETWVARRYVKDIHDKFFEMSKKE